MKTCTQCNESKNESEFSKDRQKRDGLDSWCKPCRRKKVSQFNHSPRGRAYHKRYRKTDAYRANKKMYYHRENGKATAKRASNRIREIFPDRYNSRHAVTNAVRDGKLPPAKSLDCSMKDENCRGQMEYHHHLGYDYEHRLDVVPVCQHHHRLLDRSPDKF